MGFILYYNVKNNFNSRERFDFEDLSSIELMHKCVDLDLSNSRFFFLNDLLLKKLFSRYLGESSFSLKL